MDKQIILKATNIFRISVMMNFYYQIYLDMFLIII